MLSKGRVMRTLTRRRLPFFGEACLGQFRAEAFNLFNATHLSLPTTGLTNVNFGRILSTDGDPQILQFVIETRVLARHAERHLR